MEGPRIKWFSKVGTGERQEKFHRPAYNRKDCARKIIGSCKMNLFKIFPVAGFSTIILIRQILVAAETLNNCSELV
jgi:hypothetical protein